MEIIVAKKATYATIPGLLARREIFRGDGTSIKAFVIGDTYRVESYGDFIASVNTVTGERVISERPTHKVQAGHWQLCLTHLKEGSGAAIVPVRKRPSVSASNKNRPRVYTKRTRYQYSGPVEVCSRQHRYGGYKE